MSDVTLHPFTTTQNQNNPDFKTYQRGIISSLSQKRFKDTFKTYSEFAQKTQKTQNAQNA